MQEVSGIGETFLRCHQRPRLLFFSFLPSSTSQLSSCSLLHGFNMAAAAPDIPPSRQKEGRKAALVISTWKPLPLWKRGRGRWLRTGAGAVILWCLTVAICFIPVALSVYQALSCTFFFIWTLWWSSGGAEWWGGQERDGKLHFRDKKNKAQRWKWHLTGIWMTRQRLEQMSLTLIPYSWHLTLEPMTSLDSLPSRCSTVCFQPLH